MFRRRWFQYSLRSFLIAVTALSVWLGMWVNAARRQRLARESIEKVTGSSYSIVYAHQWPGSELRKSLRRAVPPGPKWLRELIGRDFFDTVVGVAYTWPSDGSLSDADLAVLARLPRLRYIGIDDAPARIEVTNAGFAHLKGLTQLQGLFLPGAGIDDAGIAHLRALAKLQTLGLAQSYLGDASCAWIGGLRELKGLSLDGTRITDGGVMHLSRLGKLEILSLARTRITDMAASHLSRLQRLEYLSLEDTQISDVGLESLRPLTELMELHLGGTRIAGAGFSALSNLRELQHLTLGRCSNLGDAGLSNLARLPNLRALDLADTAVTDEGLKSLAAMHSLRRLGLSGTRTTAAGIAELKRKLPRCRID